MRFPPSPSRRRLSCRPHLPTFWRYALLSMASMLWLVNTTAVRADGAGQPTEDPGARARPVRIAVLGDSLTAGYGLPADASFPAQLEGALRRDGLEVVVENAGVSGDTSAGGRARLGWTLASRPDIVIVELGANDGLRGLDPARMEENLDSILGTLARKGVKALLTGMRAPRNMGEDYARRFQAVFPRLAEKHRIPFYPFFLEVVAGAPELNQADGIHPNERGVEVIVRGILPLVKGLAEEVRAMSSRRMDQTP